MTAAFIALLLLAPAPVDQHDLDRLADSIAQIEEFDCTTDTDCALKYGGDGGPEPVR